MRKTKYILQEIVKQQKNVTYYGVDLDEQSLKDCLGPSAEMFPSIKFVGLYGTYLDSLSWIHANIPSSCRKLFLWLGSSIGNMNRVEAGDFLHTVCQEAMQPGDLFFCGIDRRNAPEVIQLAYDDSQNLTRDFIMNG
jgi:uncharacterized SAM-dependent methyltransferase